MLNKLQLQNLDQPLCPKSEQNFSFMTKRQLANQQTVANMILSINLRNRNNVNKFWVGIFTRQGGSHQSSLLNSSESVSEWVSDKSKQWSDSGPINMTGNDIISQDIFAICKEWFFEKNKSFLVFLTSSVCLLSYWGNRAPIQWKCETAGEVEIQKRFLTK